MPPAGVDAGRSRSSSHRSRHPRSADSAGLVADRDELERGFRRLGAEQRAVLVLHYYVGMPVSGVAEALDDPIGTAQSRLGRALASLRVALREDAEPQQPAVREGQIA